MLGDIGMFLVRSPGGCLNGSRGHLRRDRREPQPV